MNSTSAGQERVAAMDALKDLRRLASAESTASALRESTNCTTERIAKEEAPMLLQRPLTAVETSYVLPTVPIQSVAPPAIAHGANTIVSAHAEIALPSETTPTHLASHRTNFRETFSTGARLAQQTPSCHQDSIVPEKHFSGARQPHNSANL
jgi:hypothetical protein